MAVETLTEFPASFIAGDTVRVTLANTDFPSTLWGLKVLLQSATEKKSFAATAIGSGNLGYNFVISAADSAKIKSGFYVVSFIYTEIATSERTTEEQDQAVTVYANPESPSSKSIARQTLEAMESAQLKLVSGKAAGRLSVSFNGQSFTSRNLTEFQTAIEKQRAVVAAEDQQLTGHRQIARILHPI